MTLSNVPVFYFNNVTVCCRSPNYKKNSANINIDQEILKSKLHVYTCIYMYIDTVRELVCWHGERAGEVGRRSSRSSDICALL